MTASPVFGRCLAGVALLCGVTIAAAQAPFQDTIRNLRHPDPAKRLDSVQALDNAAYTPAAEAVAPLINDPDDRLQQAAIDAELTFFLSERLTSVRILGIGNSRSRAQQAFENGVLVRGAAPAPAAVLDRLIAAMRDENPRVRFDAVHALGFIAERPLGAEASAALVAELDHYDPIMRAATVRVIDRLRVGGAGSKLVDALSDSSPIVRRFAILALGTLREERGLQAVRDAVARSRGDLLDDAIVALGRYGAPEDVPRFRQWLNDRSPVIRRAGAEGLGRARDTDSIDALRALLKDSAPQVQTAAAFALELLGDTQSHVLASLLALREDVPESVDYLLDLGPRAIPGILAALQVATAHRHRADLIQLVGHFGDRNHVTAIEPFLPDRDDRVRGAASHAIARLRR